MQRKEREETNKSPPHSSRPSSSPLHSSRRPPPPPLAGRTHPYLGPLSFHPISPSPHSDLAAASLDVPLEIRSAWAHGTCFYQMTGKIFAWCCLDMIWVSFIMQLASHDTQAEEETQLVSHSDNAEVSHSQPILSQSNTAGSSTGYLVSFEIKPVSVEDDNENIDANEETHLVIQDLPQCRICLDNGGDDLIAPCQCKGTQKYVHRSCLDNWRSTKEGFAFSHCTECRSAFLLRANVPPDRWWLRLKFQLLVVRDHTLIFFIVQLVVALLGMLVYRFYGDELREMFGYEEHPYAFYAMAILAIVLVGLLYGFFIAIICGQRITERHYHVLAKQELTKEYIVEDLEGTDRVPDLDPSHVTELRIMGLY